MVETHKKIKGAVLYVGHCYYNTWYLSRALRRLGWKADTADFESNNHSIFYHGNDIILPAASSFAAYKALIRIAAKYDIIHFSGAHTLRILHGKRFRFEKHLSDRWEIRALKALGKKIVYTNNGCLDGVLQTSFAKWEQPPVCEICPWKERSDVCSDERNRSWGEVRNELADYQILLGGNRADFNLAPKVHEVPEFYCLDKEFWKPGLEIPEEFKIKLPGDIVKIYHAVGNYDLRTRTDKKNIKSTHIYIPVIERLKAEGLKIELIFCKDVPNKDVRFYQVQSDIVVDMLTFGFFGANIREALMLGKPTICYLRPEWIREMSVEIPDYARELPVVSATPDTIYEVLKDLILNRDKREKLGKAGRRFAEKWHSAEAGARRLDEIYSELLHGEKLLLSREILKEVSPRF